MAFEIEQREHYTLVTILSEKLDTNNAPDLKSQLVVISGEDSSGRMRARGAATPSSGQPSCRI